MNSDELRFSAESLEDFCSEALKLSGVRVDVARLVASGLVETSLRGVDSHGIRLLPHYLRAVKGGRINPAPRYRFERTAGGTGVLDGDHTFGHASGSEGMRHAMELAREAGTGTVAVKNSSHFGAAACFSLLAAREEMIGISLTHADALMLSPGGTRPYFGTNPICFAAPCQNEEPVCLDMATSLVNWNKVLQARERNQTVEGGWGADVQGNETNDPQKMVSLLPIGDYKGFGLSMMVDILCSLLTGMPFGRHLSSMYQAPLHERRYLGHFFLAIEIQRLIPLEEFKARLQQMIDEVRSEPGKGNGLFVQVPGDPEKRTEKERRLGGIPLSPKEVQDLQQIARDCQLAFPTNLRGTGV